MLPNTLLYEEREPGFDENLIISDNRTKHVLPVKNILRLESRRVYTIIYTVNKAQYICSRHLKVVLNGLDPSLFFRIHKSHVVNIHEVKAYREGRGGFVILSDDTAISVAQRKKTAFLKNFYAMHSAK